MGSDRAIANPPNWNAQESQQLYAGAVNNNDPGTAEATGQAWSHHGTELKQASDHLYNAISELGNAWVGRGCRGRAGRAGGHRQLGLAGVRGRAHDVRPARPAGLGGRRGQEDAGPEGLRPQAVHGGRAGRRPGGADRRPEGAGRRGQRRQGAAGRVLQRLHQVDERGRQLDPELRPGVARHEADGLAQLRFVRPDQHASAARAR